MKTIEDLRAALFDTLAGVREGRIDLDRARMVSDLSQTIINTGKLEVDYMRQTGSTGTGFVPGDRPELPQAHHTQTGTLNRTPDGVVHRLRG